MRKITRRDRLAYFFDNTMSRGATAMIIWLALISLAVIVAAAIIIILMGLDPDPTTPGSFIEDVWLGAMHAIDTGNLAEDHGWGLRIVMLCVTLGGIFIVSTLIGVISNGLEDKLDRLRKGRSFVIEKGHTLILGWSDKVFTILSELAIAQESEQNPCIVILADKDKVEMEDAIRERVPTLRRTRVICRSGNPTSLIDIDIVNPEQCGPIIVLASEEGNADSQTLKTILALTNNPNRRQEPFYIVAEVKSARNLDVLKMVGKDEVELLLCDDLIARVMVQTCRQSGLSLVYMELMDFDGCEMYFSQEPSLTNKTFADSLLAYPECMPIGIRFSDDSVVLNPPMDTAIQDGDQLVVIAEDDSTIKLGPTLKPSFNPSTPAAADEMPFKKARSLLIIGWNDRAQVLLYELDKYVESGSILKVVSSYDCSKVIEKIRKSLSHSSLEYVQADSTDREVLEGLNAQSYDHILLLAYKDELEPHDADAETLITLLHLRNISEVSGTSLSIVSEMLDLRNRELAEVTKADDFIVSDRMISLLMSQVSQSQHLMRVFDDLFDAEGSEVYLKPVELYLTPGTPTSFYAIVDAARAREQIAIGWRKMDQQFDASRSYGMVINPAKDTVVTLNSNDRIIVISEN